MDAVTGATLKQGKKILSVFEETPKEKVQDIIKSGLLAVLRDGNIKEVDLDLFRKSLGLKPLKVQGSEDPLPSFFSHVGYVEIPATSKPFVPREHFIINTGREAKIRIYGLGGGRTSRFYMQYLGLIRKRVEGFFSRSRLRCVSLKEGLKDEEIVDAFGNEDRLETSLWELYCLLRIQYKGQKEGRLLTNGDKNIFFIRNSKGVICVINVWFEYRGVDGWQFDALPIMNIYCHSEGFRLFYRD